MTPEKMLDELDDAGGDAGSDLHDGLEGYFGWRVADGVLTISFEPAGDQDEFDSAASWRLVPIGDRT